MRYAPSLYPAQNGRPLLLPPFLLSPSILFPSSNQHLFTPGTTPVLSTDVFAPRCRLGTKDKICPRAGSVLDRSQLLSFGVGRRSDHTSSLRNLDTQDWCRSAICPYPKYIHLTVDYYNNSTLTHRDTWRPPALSPGRGIWPATTRRLPRCRTAPFGVRDTRT